MKYLKFIFIFLFTLGCLTACSVFAPTPKFSKEQIWQQLWLAACPVSEGKGQIFLSKRTYAFTYESIWNSVDNFWAIALEVPVRGEETLIVPFEAKAGFSGSLLLGLDKKSIKAIGKETFVAWKKSWVEMLTFLHQRESWSKKIWEEGQCRDNLKCQGEQDLIFWKFDEDHIELKTVADKGKSTFSWNFKRTQEGLQFTQQTVTLRHQKNSQTISLNLYPTHCGK